MSTEGCRQAALFSTDCFGTVSCIERTFLPKYNDNVQLVNRRIEEWELEKKNVPESWDNKGNIIIGNDVWISYEDEIIAELLKTKWWDWSEEKIVQNIQAIQSGQIEQLRY